jgi:hypothetical protein
MLVTEMCKEMPVFPVNRMLDTKTMIKEIEGYGGDEAQREADQKHGL